MSYYERTIIRKLTQDDINYYRDEYKRELLTLMSVYKTNNSALT